MDRQIIEDSLKRIEDQLAANLGYFSGDDTETLRILQGHIRNQLGVIRGALPVPATAQDLLSEEERRSGVIISTDREGRETRVSAKEWRDQPTRITIGAHIQDGAWQETELEPADAAKLAALLLSKPSVKQVTSGGAG